MENNNLAPVALFVYKRLDHTIKTVDSLKRNILASKTDLFIFSDASRNSEDKKGVSEVRKYIKEITGFKSIKIKKNKINKGLANSIINGVTDVIKINSKIIVVEDDMVVSSVFLDFMNTSLEKYRLNKKIWHISGWNYPLNIKTVENLFFWDTMNCWGWGTWEDRWEHFNKNPEKLINNWNSEKIYSFDLNNSGVFWQQVEDNFNKKINTWAIFWYATIFHNNGLCLNPCKSLVQNIGLDGSGTNCGTNNSSETSLELQGLNEFTFPDIPKKSYYATKKIVRYYKKRKSIFSKIKRKLNF